MAWLTVQMQMLAPLVGLVRDCKVFCQPPTRSRPFKVLAVVYTLLINTLILTGPAVRANLFHLYAFPKSFRWKFDLLGLSTIFYFSLILYVVRRVLSTLEKRRVQPMLVTAHC